MEHLHIELESYNASRPMVIACKGDEGNVKRFILALAESNITIGALVDDALPYVNTHEIERLAGLFNWRGCDSIIALGGESVMDIAKTLNLKVNGIGIKETLKIDSPLSPLVYIATAKVNGYEVTNSVNIDGKILKSDFLYPDIVCIDNRMVCAKYNLQSVLYVALYSLTHCIEGAEMANNNPFVDASAFSAIRLIMDNLTIVAKNPNDKKASAGLINGIAIAGTIQSNTQGHICCLSAEFLAKEAGLAQGMLAGMMLAPSLQHKVDQNHQLRADLLLALVGIDQFCSTPKEVKISKAIEEIKNFTNFFGDTIPKSLSDLKIQEYQLRNIAQKVEEKSKGQISKEYCYNFLQKIWRASHEL